MSAIPKNIDGDEILHLEPLIGRLERIESWLENAGNLNRRLEKQGAEIDAQREKIAGLEKIIAVQGDTIRDLNHRTAVTEDAIHRLIEIIERLCNKPPGFEAAIDPDQAFHALLEQAIRGEGPVGE